MEEAYVGGFRSTHVGGFRSTHSAKRGRRGVVNGCRRSTQLLLRCINNGRGVTTISRYMSEVHFILGSPTGTSITGVRTLGSTGNAFARTNRFRIVVNGAIDSFCGSFVTISNVSNISGSTIGDTTGRGRGTLRGIVDILTRVFTPLVPTVVANNLVLNFHGYVSDVCFFGGNARALYGVDRF